jgi:LacI family transcriptional regulator
MLQPRRPKGDGPEVGIRDVARRARVSTATVSRALNRPQSVTATARLRVERAVEELGYVPHAAARALTTRRSQTIGAIIPTIDNAIFAKGIQALNGHLEGRGYHVLLATSEYDPEIEERQARNLVMRGVDGLIFMGDSHTRRLRAFLAERGMPYVNTGVYRREGGEACVGFDNRAAAARAAQHLVELGHRRIAMIAGIRRNNDRATDRVAGVTEALRAAGVPLPDEWILECRYDFSEAGQALRRLLALSPRPSAILCGNDVLAIGALFEAQAAGVRVPAELSIVGFDDLELARHVRPGLTTMRVPTDEMWRRAADYLLNVLARRPAADRFEIEVTLVVRESTGPFRGD